MSRYIIVIAASFCLGLVAVQSARGQSRPPLPDFGLMYNNDGDIMFAYENTSTNSHFLRSRLDGLKDTPIQTYMWCIGTDVLHYPSQVGSTWGWRTTPYDDDPAWTKRINYGRSYVQQNYDPIQVVAEHVKSMGKYFIPSYRMNDDHFVVDPQNYPLTGKFWLDNQDKTIGTSPMQGYDYSNLLNYEHQAVRNHRMAVINESIDRYANVMDGYGLDFNRVQIFFSPGEAGTHKHLITEMVQQVRAKLDQVAARTGRPQYLFVRTPPALHNNQWAGLEVEKWISERTVDVVIPSVLQTMSHDVPVRQFIDIARSSGSGVQVAPAIYPRTNAGVDLKPRPMASGGYTGPQNFRVASTELARGAASNYRHLGTDGVQMYNWGVDWPANWYQTAEALGSDEPTLGKDRVFAVTPSYFTDNEDTFEYAKQVPHTVGAQGSKSFNLIMGDDVNRMIRERPDDVVLRLGLTGTSSDRPVTLAINGRQLHSGQMGAKYFPVSLPAASDTPTAYFQVAVDDLRALLRGDNTITVHNTGSFSGIRITDMQLGVFGTSAPGAGPVESRREPDPSMLRQVYEDGSGPTLTYTINDRANNGFGQPLGGVYFMGQASSNVTSYDRVAGFAFDQAMYYPSVEGALESLDYSFYLSKTSGSRPTSLVSLMLMQDGKVYSLDERYSIENDDTVLSQIIAGTSLKAEDFLLEKAQGDGFVLDPSQHPDFSEDGSPLYFGWLLSRSANPAVGGNDQPYTDLDDLLLTFHTAVPEPSSAVSVIGALSIMLMRRRARFL
ncbi:MAG TPA: hypothetical protein VGR35_16340 [Tepidisphaeraceae bacterium]|nr:hypothetical protein [Tepidisphaeraceae bacterium]